MEAFIEAAVRLSLPLVLAALAGILCERSGVVNVALEGLILGGAFVAALVVTQSGSWTVGLFAVVAFGVIAGAALGWSMVALWADQIVVGIMFNLLMLGATSYAVSVVTRSDPLALTTGQMPRLGIPLLSATPLLGPSLFKQNALGYVAFGIIVAVHILLFRTGSGIRLRAAGEFAEGARSVGVNVLRTRVVVYSASSAIAALGGAYLVLGHAGRFVTDMSAGRGYIALAVIILSRWNPVGALFAALLIGGSDALQLRLQAQGLGIPVQFALAFPYVATLVAVTVLGRRVRPPSELGRPVPQ